MNKEITVLTFKADAEVKAVNVKDDLKTKQGLVGGLLDVLRLPMGIDLWVNDEGMLHNLPHVLNVEYRGQAIPIFGDCFLAGHDGEGNTISLTREQAAWVQERLFAGINGRNEVVAALRM